MGETTRWRRLEGLFDAALDRPAEDREAWVRGACEDDPSLAGEVLALLDADDAGDALDAAIARPGDPTHIGPYRVERRLGEGGMGVVYLATRDGSDVPVRHAVKTLHAGWSDLLGQRLRTERRILLRLEHPNIARIVDGGRSDDGRPYFVMEYVDGRPLLEHARGLDLAARLKLFVEVCDAVHFAHQRLVIHRDLKPSNILVDARGQTKLLDFGVAKVLAEEETTGPLTSPTQPAGFTPEYASPEQLRGEPVTTASDVYSLGVVLFELLTETRYAEPGLRALPREARAAIPARAPSRAVDASRARRLRG
ncbi:serine/threonine protein kinase, partial [Myxococcota bacterium]|nr:serine/threonine protein kinase [Myxococcota bacterium]